MGRPSKFDPAKIKQARKLVLLGAIEKDLADFFEVSVDTITEWKKTHPEFSASLKEAKDELDAKVVRSLFQRAMGYSHPDVHVSNYQGQVTLTPITKHYAPDTTACIFWLKNRQPELWRDRQEVTGKDGGPVEVVSNPTEEARAIAFAMAEAAEALRKAKRSSEEAA